MRLPHYFSESLYENHQNNCTQYKTMKTTFPKKSKAVFISIRYRKTSQTQDVKSQSTKRSVRKLAQPKLDSAFEQETRFVSSAEICGSSQNSFFSYNQSNKPIRAQKKFLERTQGRFGNFPFSSRRKSCFYKYSISQDISNAGCKEPKYQT